MPQDLKCCLGELFEFFSDILQQKNYGIFSSIWIVSKIHALAIVIYEYFFPCVNIIA